MSNPFSSKSNPFAKKGGNMFGASSGSNQVFKKTQEPDAEMRSEADNPPSSVAKESSSAIGGASMFSQKKSEPATSIFKTPSARLSERKEPEREERPEGKF